MRWNVPCLARHERFIPWDDYIDVGMPKTYKFEDTVICGAENADAYLTSLYGDWRKLLPKEKQVTHHDFIMCDLGKSFLEE